MGKRTNFERMERDFYPTPAEAVAPLLMAIGPVDFTFDEPCAGDGSLIDHIGPKRCAYASDVSPRRGDIFCRDVFNRKACQGDMFITNPPWAWETLNRLITHLSNIAPTWLLLNADLAHNRRMSSHMRRCRKIVSVGRVSWMQNGKKGFENCAWYLFDGGFSGQTEFYARS